MAATTVPRDPVRTARNGRGAAEREDAPPKTFDAAVYWITFAAIYVLQGAVWFYSARGKIFDDGLAAPPPIEKQFDGTFIDSFPGTDVAWATLGILQGLVFIGLVVSLVRGEFLPKHRKPWLLGTLGGGLLVFALLAFGQEMTEQYAGTASLYAYFGATAVVMILVRLMPPYRAARWLD